jgi:hypothetical protein
MYTLPKAVREVIAKINRGVNYTYFSDSITQTGIVETQWRLTGGVDLPELCGEVSVTATGHGLRIRGRNVVKSAHKECKKNHAAHDMITALEQVLCVIRVAERIQRAQKKATARENVIRMHKKQVPMSHRF